MKIRTKDLTGAALDWAVAKCEDIRVGHPGFWTNAVVVAFENGTECPWPYSTSWAQGGSIIDHMVREGLRLTGYKSLPTDPTSCQAQIGNIVTGGPTPLIAAMRCYVASKLGDEVEIPEELLPAEL